MKIKSEQASRIEKDDDITGTQIEPITAETGDTNPNVVVTTNRCK